MGLTETAETAESVVWGPTYRELSDPASIPENVREAARLARLRARDPLNLHNLHWMDDLGEVTGVVLPSDLTSVSTPIALLLGEKYPCGVAHSGSAYATLVEKQLHQEILPGQGRLVVPSPGAVGLGMACAARMMGYAVTAVIPQSAAGLRRGPLEAIGATVAVGGEDAADVLETIDAARALVSDGDTLLNPYDDFAAYRYHAVVTAAAVRALEAALPGAGQRRLAAFVAPTGAGSLLAAGDGLAGTATIAAEPAGCAPLADGSWDSHGLPDVGPRVPLWVDNVMDWDAAVAVEREDLWTAHRVFGQPPEALTALGLRDAAAQRLSGTCGPAACMALVAALKAIRYYGWGPDELVVVAAPEGGAVASPVAEDLLRRDVEQLGAVRTDGVIEATRTLRRRWHNQKHGPWVDRFGKGKDALKRQEDREFWAEQRRWSASIDERVLAFREPAC